MSLSQEVASILFDYTDEIPENVYLQIMKDLQQMPVNEDMLPLDVCQRKITELKEEEQTLNERINENNRYTEYYKNQYRQECKKLKHGKILVNNLSHRIDALERKLNIRESICSLSISILGTPVCIDELNNKTLIDILKPINRRDWFGTTKPKLLKTIYHYKNDLFI